MNVENPGTTAVPAPPPTVPPPGHTSTIPSGQAVVNSDQTQADTGNTSASSQQHSTVTLLEDGEINSTRTSTSNDEASGHSALDRPVLKQLPKGTLTVPVGNPLADFDYSPILVSPTQQETTSQE